MIHQILSHFGASLHLITRGEISLKKWGTRSPKNLLCHQVNHPRATPRHHVSIATNSTPGCIAWWSASYVDDPRKLILNLGSMYLRVMVLLGQDQYETYVEGIAFRHSGVFDEHVRYLYSSIYLWSWLFLTHPRPLHAGSAGRRNLPVNVASGEIYHPVVDRLFLANC